MGPRPTRSALRLAGMPCVAATSCVARCAVSASSTRICVFGVAWRGVRLEGEW